MESDNFRKWVIAAHLVANQNFSDAAIRNEFLLIGIGFMPMRVMKSILLQI